MIIKKYKTFENREESESELCYITGENIVLSNYLDSLDKIYVEPSKMLNTLNSEYLGLVFIDNFKDDQMSILANVTQYFIQDYKLKINLTFISKSYNIRTFPHEIKITKDKEREISLDRWDTIHKLQINKPTPPKIRWYKKGKLENDKSFENKMNEEVRWFKNGKLSHDPEFFKNDELSSSFVTDENLRNFLYNKGILEEFIQYTDNEYKKRFWKAYGRDVIDICLRWGELGDRASFWIDVSNEWRDYYDEHFGYNDNDDYDNHDDDDYNYDDDMENNEAVRWYKKGKLIRDDSVNYTTPQYDDFITDDEFRQFLIDNDAYGIFLIYCKDRIKEDFETYFNDDIINVALSWSSTPQPEREQWSALHIKWKKIYNKRINNEAVRWYKNGKLTLDTSINYITPQYDDFITDDEFRQFLIDNDAYDEFIKHSHIKDDFREKFSSRIIDHALIWDSTPSGSKYWNELNRKWNLIYSQKPF